MGVLDIKDIILQIRGEKISLGNKNINKKIYKEYSLTHWGNGQVGQGSQEKDAWFT